MLVGMPALHWEHHIPIDGPEQVSVASGNGGAVGEHTEAGGGVLGWGDS